MSAFGSSEMLATCMYETFPPDRTSFSQLSRSSALLERGCQAALTIPQTPLIGRAADVAATGEALRSLEARFMALTGPGEVGKPHVAIHVTTELQTEFAILWLTVTTGTISWIMHG